ncbi:unnamed protein product [Closterium sp. NIES-65]|nr:unnamed protein product [Closterium sp. NIES-65]
MQVKVVMREADRVGLDGKPPSKGAAFIEFSEHQHAVTALRALNNHPTIFSHDARPIVEFAIENVSIVNQRQHTSISPPLYPFPSLTSGSPSKKKQKQVKGGKGQGQQERLWKGPAKDVKGHAGAQVQAGAAAGQQNVGVKAPGGAERGGASGSRKGELKRKQKGAARGAGVSPAAAVKPIAASPAADLKAALAAVSPGA